MMTGVLGKVASTASQTVMEAECRGIIKSYISGGNFLYQWEIHAFLSIKELLDTCLCKWKWIP